jgi:hypothetical protein
LQIKTPYIDLTTSHVNKNGINDSFHLTRKTDKGNDQLKNRQSVKANAEAQLFKIIGGMSSGPGLMLLSNSSNAFSTSDTANGGDPKSGSQFFH